MQSYEGRGVSHSCHLIVLYNLAAAGPCQAPWRFWCAWPCMVAAALWKAGLKPLCSSTCSPASPAAAQWPPRAAARAPCTMLN